MKPILSIVLTALLSAGVFIQPAHAVDAAQAEMLMKKNKCTSCHHATKTKSGPSIAKMAEELKAKPDAEQFIITQITTGPEIEIDGEKEKHKKIKETDQAKLKNLAQWILSH